MDTYKAARRADSTRRAHTPLRGSQHVMKFRVLLFFSPFPFFFLVSSKLVGKRRICHPQSQKRNSQENLKLPTSNQQFERHATLLLKL